jgi:hypothetical protein
MSFQDQPRQQRPPRYPAHAQYADGYPSDQDTQADRGGGNGYQNGYQGFAGLAGAPRQRPPWDQQGGSDTGGRLMARDTGEQRSLWDTGGQRAARDTGGQRAARDTGGQRAARDTGGQESLWDTSAEQPLRNTGAHRLRTTGWQSAARNTGGQPSASQAEGELPRRAPEVFRGLAGDDSGWPLGTQHGQRRAGGVLIGAVAGFLAAAVALGVANLIAAFVRPQASPIIAVGGAFIDRTPSALKNFAVAKFGENDKNMLLLGMYVTIAFIAIAIGVLAWRRIWAGVAGIGLFGLFGAFVAITRPDSHVTDVIPSIVGGIAGVIAIVWLIRSGMPGTRSAWARGR